MTDYETELEAAISRVTRESDKLADPDDAERVERMAKAYNEDNLVVSVPDDRKPLAASTLKNYVTGLAKVGKSIALMEASATEWNRVFQNIYDGTHPEAKDSGYTKGSIRVYQNGARAFLHAYPNSGATPDDIALFNPQSNKVDPSDMLTREEIHALRSATTNTRDLALLDFLLYTGQRNTATRTLRIRDLDLDSGRFQLNTDANGLKGAEQNGKWRDLLLSQATVRQWLNNGHPAPNDPDAYVFTTLPSHSRADPYSPLSDESVTRIIRDLAEKAREECPSMKGKPIYPHALRHNFVTISLRRGMAESAIKHQIGHAPESSIMESTYSHLQDSDHIQEAREAYGLETEQLENELAPESCPRCGAPAHEAASFCNVCHVEFSMDAKEVTDEIDDAIHESKGQAAAEGDEQAEMGADTAREKIMNDPEAKEAVMNDLKDELLDELRDEL